MSSFDLALIREQALFGEPALKWGNVVGSSPAGVKFHGGDGGISDHVQFLPVLHRLSEHITYACCLLGMQHLSMEVVTVMLAVWIQLPH